MRKQIASLVAIIGFFIVMGLLILKLFPQVDGIVFGKNYEKESMIETHNYKIVREIKLGAIKPMVLKQMGSVGGIIKTSSTKKYFAIGTDSGKIIVLKNTGESLWEVGSETDKISDLCFDRDDRYLIVGEESPRLAVRCFDLSNGKEIWHQEFGSEMGYDLKNKIYPSINSIITDCNDNIFVVAQNYSFTPAKTREYISKIYKLSKNGKVLASYPEKDMIDANVLSISVTNDGKKLFSPAANYYQRDNLRFNQNLYCIDSALSQVLWTKKFDAVIPNKVSTIRRAPDIDNDMLALIIGDGRCLAYDFDGNEKWHQQVSVPEKVLGIYLSPSGVNCVINNERVFFVTSNTTNRINSQVPINIEHPSSNSVFIFDKLGNFLRKVSFDGMIGSRTGQIEFEGDNFVVAIGPNTVTGKRDKHGVYVVNYMTGELIETIRTDGPCISAATDHDSKHIALIEAPLKDEQGIIHGEYCLYVLERKE